MDKILNSLNSKIQNTNKNKSSSYKMYLKNIDYENIYSQFATGGFQKKTFLEIFLIFFFQD
jgi:hypothetical protein